MIELARSSIEQIDARLERLDAERESLTILRAGWERESLTILRAGWERYLALDGIAAGAIEQPRIHGAEAEATSTLAHGEAASESGVVSPIEQPVRRAARSSPGLAVGPSAPVSPELHPCQFCNKLLAARGKPTHERYCESNPDRVTTWKPQPVGVGSVAQPPAAPSRESFVCDRCNDPFPSRQALAEHRRGHPEIPPSQPVRRAFRNHFEQMANGGDA